MSKPRIRRFSLRCAWTLRPHGGMFLGGRLQFPTRTIFGNGDVRDVWHVSAGLIVIQILLEVRGRVIARVITKLERRRR